MQPQGTVVTALAKAAWAQILPPLFACPRSIVASSVVILSETRKQRTHVTPLRYLAATDASGGVARQQKIMHVHDSAFYHYTQFPHILPLKKYSQILFEQTVYLLIYLNS
jgi:hypothetical protein